MNGQVFIGYDPREDLACRVAALSIARRDTSASDISFLRLADCRAAGLYTRPLQRRGRGLYDPISEAPMTTEHSIARFLVPWLAPRQAQWALFIDGDVLVLGDLKNLWAQADPRKAVQVVQHDAAKFEGATEKKGGLPQTTYRRKNWSSVVLWNLRHQAHAHLTRELINTLPGRELHAFCWLKDAEIGRLDPAWNHLIGVDKRRADARLAHFTLGLPYVPGYHDSEYATDWRLEMTHLAAAQEVPA